MTIPGGVQGEDRPELVVRRGIRVRWIVLLVLTALVVTIAVSEHQRPGVFYDVVWARVQGWRDFGDAQALDNRQVAADFAREAAGWPGVSRVGWPDVQVYDGDRGRMDPQLGSFTVVVDPHDGSVPDLARRALDESSAAAGLGMRLDVTLQVDDLRLVVTETPSDDLELALDVFEKARDDRRVSGGRVSLAAYAQTPGDLDPFSISLYALRPEGVAGVQQDLCGPLVDAGRFCRVVGPAEG